MQSDDRAESGEETVRTVALWLTKAMTVFGLVSVAVAAVWWIYTEYQDGLTPATLGNFGMVLLVGGAALFLLFGVRNPAGKTIYESLTEDIRDD